MSKLAGGAIGRPVKMHGHATIIGARGEGASKHWTCNNGYLTEKFAVRSVAFSDFEGDGLVVRPVTSVRQKPDDVSNKHCTNQTIEEGDYVFEYTRRHTRSERTVFSVREDGPTGDLVLVELPTSQACELFNRLERTSPKAVTFLEGAHESYDSLSDDNSSKLPDGLGWENGMTKHMLLKEGRVKAFIRGVTNPELRAKILEHAKYTLARDIPTRWAEAPLIEKGHTIPVDSTSTYIMYRIDGSVSQVIPVGWEPYPLPLDALSLLKIDFLDHGNQKTMKWQLFKVKGAMPISPNAAAPARRPQRHQERRNAARERNGNR